MLPPSLSEILFSIYLYDLDNFKVARQQMLGRAFLQGVLLYLQIINWGQQDLESETYRRTHYFRG